MDPLSVTLAVVSLATAVKDMVELAQKIDESFAKVSNNLRKAQRVAKDIAEMVKKIRIFYTSHQDSLNNTENFRVALLILLARFKSFEASILPLLPKTDGKKLGRFIRGWWNNNKIEERILDLQSNILRVMLEYMVDSAMRTEVKLATIHQETSKGLTGIIQGLEVVRRDVSALRITAAPAVAHHSHEVSRRRSDEFNRNIIMLAQSRTSTSTPMLRTPDVITEELMTTAYIKLQINNIAMIVGKMTTLPASATTNTEFRLAKVFEQPSMSITHLRHDVVRQVTMIRDLLDRKRIQSFSIYNGARALNELAVGLGELRMRDESMLVGKWAIMLTRALVDVSRKRQPNFVAYLALYLVNHSIQYGSVNNHNMVQNPQIFGESYRTNQNHRMKLVKESYAIAQNLRSLHAGEVPFQILYSHVLMEYAALADVDTAIEITIEVIQVLETILKVQAFTQPNSPQIFDVVRPSSAFLNQLFSSAPTAFSITIYAFALGNLGHYLHRLSFKLHNGSALNLLLLEIAVFRKMVSIYGHVNRVHLAMALWFLVDGVAGRNIPAGELVQMIDECVSLFRVLVEQNPLSYARNLVLVLSRKAKTLELLNRDSEAIASWQEAATLAEQIVQDSKLCAEALGNLSNYFRRLKRHGDAAHTGALAIAATPKGANYSIAWQYSCLSDDFQQLRRYREAAEAAQASVTHYRHLAMVEPQHGTRYLTEQLSRLAHCLAALDNYSDALIAWKESVNMVDNYLNHIPDKEFSGSKEYFAALRIHLSISYALEDEEECLKVCSTVVQRFRQLSELDSEREGIILSLWSAEFHYAHNMFRFGRLKAAHQYIDHWLYVCNGEFVAVSAPKAAEWHTSMIILTADVLDAQSYAKQALLVSQTAHDIVRPSLKSHQPVFGKMIDAMVQQARLQGNLGNGAEALCVAEEALRFSRDNKLDPVVGTLVLSLHEVAFAALACWNYKRAIDAAQEGCKILSCPEGSKIWETSEQNISKRASLYSILSSAAANLGNRSTAIEYAYRAVDLSMDIKERKADISATTAERSYMETRGNLADILLAAGHLTQALEICRDRRDYFSRRVDKWMGDYRELAPVLRMLGILACSEGHHKEGEAAAKELLRIMRTLGTTFPSLQEQVKIRLRNKAKVPILEVLNDMCLKLDCEHQAGVVSLFEV